MMKWLIQEDGPGCILFALCNALRYFDAPSPEPGGEGWEDLVAIGGGRYGPVTRPRKVAEKLGLELELCKKEEVEPPAMVSLYFEDDETDVNLHVCLVAGVFGRGEKMTLINYLPGEVATRTSSVDEIPWAMEPNNQHYNLIIPFFGPRI